MYRTLYSTFSHHYDVEEENFLKLIQYQCSKKKDVFLICAKGSYVEQHAYHMNIPFQSFPTLRRGSFDLRTFFVLRKYLETEGLQIIHHLGHDALFSLITALGKQPKVPLIYTCKESHIKKRFNRFQKILIRRVDRVILNSEYALPTFCKISGLLPRRCIVQKPIFDLRKNKGVQHCIGIILSEGDSSKKVTRTLNLIKPFISDPRGIYEYVIYINGDADKSVLKPMVDKFFSKYSMPSYGFFDRNNFQNHLAKLIIVGRSSTLADEICLTCLTLGGGVISPPGFLAQEMADKIDGKVVIQRNNNGLNALELYSRLENSEFLQVESVDEYILTLKEFCSSFDDAHLKAMGRRNRKR